MELQGAGLCAEVEVVAEAVAEEPFEEEEDTVIEGHEEDEVVLEEVVEAQEEVTRIFRGLLVAFEVAVRENLARRSGAQ